MPYGSGDRAEGEDEHQPQGTSLRESGRILISYGSSPPLSDFRRARNGFAPRTTLVSVYQANLTPGLHTCVCRALEPLPVDQKP